MPSQEFTQPVQASYGSRSVAVEPGVKHRRQFAAAADISGGVVSSTADLNSFSIYVDVGGSIDLTLEMSPDGGTTWIELPESPVSYSSSTQDVLDINYEGDEIRVTGSNTTATSLWIYGV